MNIADLRHAIHAPLESFCGYPLNMADNLEEQPEGPHATYKFTTPYAKGVGQENLETITDGDVTKLRMVEDYQTTISFTAYAMDDDLSLNLAQRIYDWFKFFGVETLQYIGVAVVDITNITNRDAFVIENYERRNGFDVIMRVRRMQEMEINPIETVEFVEEP